MKRHYEHLIREYLSYFPCVVLVGARQTGKSTLIGMVSENRELFDLENRADYRQIAGDPDQFLRLNDKPMAIVEAQLLPDLSPALRVAIDRDRAHYGKYLLSGSSSPDLLTCISESLAGRKKGQSRMDLHPGQGAQVVAMVDYCEVCEVDEVPDLYYGGEEGFHSVIDILEDACFNLLKRCANTLN